MTKNSTRRVCGWLSLSLLGLALAAVGCSSAPDEDEGIGTSNDAYTGVNRCVVPEGGDPFIPMNGWKCVTSGFSRTSCNKSSFSGRRSCQSFIANEGGGKSYGIRNGVFSQYEDDGESVQVQYELGARQECVADVCSGYNAESTYEVWTGRWAAQPIYRERSLSAHTGRDLTLGNGVIVGGWSAWKNGWPRGF
jgi:hypothetical protein